MNRNPPRAARCVDCNRCISPTRVHLCPSRSLECVRGHLWAETAQYTHDGRRHCSECRKLRYVPKRGRMSDLRCFRGHPKLARTWRWTGNHYRCMTCREMARKNRAA